MRQFTQFLVVSALRYLCTERKQVKIWGIQRYEA